MSEREAGRAMSVAEYLRYDEASLLRHEYVRGEVYAMSGVTLRHNTIARNVIGRLLPAAGDGPCQIFFSDVRLGAADDVYYYPDVIVACGAFDDLDVIVRDPCVVVEVTSPTTARVDRSEKLLAYRGIASLRAYLIVDHRRRRVERHWHDLTSAWVHDEVVGEGSVPVPCLNVALPLDEIYRGVELPTVAEPDPVGYEA